MTMNTNDAVAVLREALTKIEYSMRQAKNPGNDRWRELDLSHNLALSALAATESAATVAKEGGEVINGYVAPFRVEVDKHDVVSIWDADDCGMPFELNTHTQRALDDAKGLEEEKQAAIALAQFIVDGMNMQATPKPEASERVLDIYDEIECDLAALFGRASKEGHEVGQQLASELKSKLRLARQAPSIAVPADYLTQPDALGMRDDIRRYCEAKGGWKPDGIAQVGAVPAGSIGDDAEFQRLLRGYGEARAQMFSENVIPRMKQLVAYIDARSHVAAAPTGYALVPLRPNLAMQRVMDEDSWQWEDLLASADAITEQEYNELAAVPTSDVLAEVERKEVHGAICVFINRTPHNRDIPHGTKLIAQGAAAPDTSARDATK